MASILDKVAIGACRRMTSTKSSIGRMASVRSQQPSSTNIASMNPYMSHLRPTSTAISTAETRRNFHNTTSSLNDAPPPAADDTPKLSPKLEELFQKIIYLDMVEIHLLTELINEKLGVTISDAEKQRMAQGGGGGGSKKEEAKEEVKEEQTAFDLKLTGFDAKAKIKVIKEVRAITGLGLKEAKEMVEGVPSAVKKGIKKEEAEELKAKLEAIGAQVEIS